MSVADICARFFLEFSHSNVLIPLIIFGYIWLDSKIFLHATLVLFLSIMVNFALKSTFQVPLAVWLNKPGSYAFPSGHMQAAAIFYGWLFLHLSSVYLRLAIIIMLTGVGVSLVYFNYHNYFDVFGAVLTAIVLLSLYNYILLNYKNAIYPSVLISATAVFIYINFVNVMPLHVWVCYYGIIGVILAKYTASYSGLSMHRNTKILATLLCVAVILLSQGFNLLISPLELPLFVSQMQWVAICYLVFASPDLVLKLDSVKRN